MTFGTSPTLGTGNSYGFATGNFGLSTFNATSYLGLNADVNNTGYQFKPIVQPNITSPGPGYMVLEQFVLQTTLNNNLNGVVANGGANYNAGGATSDWDFQSSDPADVDPISVPEPSSLLLLALTGIPIAVRYGLRRRTKVS